MISGQGLRITGDVSIRPCNTVNPEGTIFLIMGPTGAGKSTFIEALAGASHTLGISKNQLAGYTQQVNAYKLTNATCSWRNDNKKPLYLIDTPGFSDSKMSEMEIVSSVKKWMVDHNLSYISHILYLCPITDTRVPGSKRRTIKMIQSLLRENSSASVTVVTTMWDTISTPQARKRAKDHFLQLRNDIWKKSVCGGTQFAAFQNDHDSTLEIIKRIVATDYGRAPLDISDVTANAPSAPFLYQELLDRISSSRQERDILRLDQIQLIAEPNQQLESFVSPRIQEVKQDISKFLKQLAEFGTPPPGFEAVPRQIAYQELLDSVIEAQEIQRALQEALDQLKSQPEHHTSREFILLEQLTRMDEDIVSSAARVVEFGSPPKGFDLVVFPRHILTGKNRARQRLHRGVHLFTKLKTSRSKDG